jgi:hypothetical protein
MVVAKLARFVLELRGLTPRRGGEGLLSALITNEILKSIKFEVAAPGGTDTLVSYSFTNATIIIRTESHTGAIGDVPLEEVSFNFQKISETVGSSVAVDDTGGAP